MIIRLSPSHPCCHKLLLCTQHSFSSAAAASNYKIAHWNALCDLPLLPAPQYHSNQILGQCEAHCELSEYTLRVRGESSSFLLQPFKQLIASGQEEIRSFIPALQLYSLCCCGWKFKYSRLWLAMHADIELQGHPCTSYPIIIPWYPKRADFQTRRWWSLGYSLRTQGHHRLYVNLGKMLNMR